MSTEASRVDIVIPCYNYGNFLRECVESVLTQEGVDFRILIIDDCSPDDTPTVAEQLTKQDRRIEYRRHAHNIGHIATYNEGLDWASSAYLLLLSADDLITAGSLARAVQLLDAHPDVSLAYGRWHILEPGKSIPPTPTTSASGWSIMSGTDFMENAFAAANNPIACPAAVVVRNRVQKHIGGYKPELPHSGDMEMWVRFALHGSIGILDSYQGVYRKHEQNMSLGYYRRPKVDLQQRLDACLTILKNHGEHIADGQRLEGLARRAVAHDAFWSSVGAFDRADKSAFLECLHLAESIYPDVQTWPAYRHLQWKRMMGCKLWSLMAPSLRFGLAKARSLRPALRKKSALLNS